MKTMTSLLGVAAFLFAFIAPGDVETPRTGAQNGPASAETADEYQALSHEATRFEIDSEHTFVSFTVQRFEMVKVMGFFPHVEGVIQLDGEDVHANIRIPTDEVYLGNSDGRGRAVRSKNFLHTAEYPEIRFETVSVRTSGDGHVAEADLTIREVTKRIEFPFTMKGPVTDPTGLETIAIEGSVTIDRLEFGVPFDRKLPGGGDFIGRDVEIQVHALAVASE